MRLAINVVAYATAPVACLSSAWVAVATVVVIVVVAIVFKSLAESSSDNIMSPQLVLAWCYPNDATRLCLTLSEANINIK